jgi:hypothetical protein
VVVAAWGGGGVIDDTGAVAPSGNIAGRAQQFPGSGVFYRDSSGPGVRGWKRAESLGTWPALSGVARVRALGS